MRILELINRLGLGGAERMLATLAFALQDRGHSVHIICLREFADAPVPRESFEAAGVSLWELKKTDGFSFSVLRSIADYCRSEEISVIHAHTHQVNHYAVGAALLAGVPVVVNTIHGISALNMQWWAKGLFRASCMLTDRVVGVCDEVKVAAQERLALPASKTEVIYNGIQPHEYLSIAPRRADGRFVFGTAGRLAAVKNQRSMIEAFAMVYQRHPHCRLEILGSGELQQELELLAEELGVRDAVLFRGFSCEVSAFLAGIDCFVLSSRSEGLPMALLEAMAAAVPVVTTAVGGVTEVVEEAQCGWLCRPDDSATLADTMLCAIHAADRLERGMRGRASVLRRYTEAVMAESYIELFSRMLEVRQHARPAPDRSSIERA